MSHKHWKVRVSEETGLKNRDVTLIKGFGDHTKSPLDRRHDEGSSVTYCQIRGENLRSDPRVSKIPF